MPVNKIKKTLAWKNHHRKPHLVSIIATLAHHRGIKTTAELWSIRPEVQRCVFAAMLAIDPEVTRAKKNAVGQQVDWAITQQSDADLRISHPAGLVMKREYRAMLAHAGIL